MEQSIGSVLVVGAGIAGIRSALDLAETGYQVFLTDNSPYLGGILSKLDNQFPNNHCGMCKMLPTVGREHASQFCMRKSLFHENINIMPFTEVIKISGGPGAFEIELLRHERHVDTDLCIGDGLCEDVCPIKTPDEFNHGLTERKAIFRPVPHNLPNMYLIDAQACTKCGECVRACPVNAINLEAQDESLTVNVDSIILATGTQLYDPRVHDEMSGYLVSRDVVTALEFERMLSASGSFDHSIRRPSDGRPVRRIAWLQCVGSRNRKYGYDYCSSICCMYALKEAILAREKGGSDVEATIFYMDMRTFGKDFYRYRSYAEEEHGVRLVQCRIQNIILAEDGGLRIRFHDRKTGEFKSETFDVAVLSTGQTPYEDNKKLAALIGTDVAPSGLLPSPSFEKVKTSVDGVFMCGSVTEMTDISEAIAGGSAAAGEASKLLVSLRRNMKEGERPPDERSSEREPSCVTAIICSCKEGKLHEQYHAEGIRELVAKSCHPQQVHIVEELCQGTCDNEVEEIIRQGKWNRVVFGACSNAAYQQGLRRLARNAGLNSSLIDVADLRGVFHHHLPAKGRQGAIFEAARHLTDILEKMKYAEPLHSKNIPINQQALVVGGGVAGMRGALSLAERGVDVHLVEKSGELGGHAGRRLRYMINGWDPVRFLAELKQQVYDNERVTIHLNSVIVESTGTLGSFKTVLAKPDGERRTIEHGSAILATGGKEASTREYGFGESERVVTQSDFEEKLADGSLGVDDLATVVMIQCVGSRERDAKEYCSRVCCMAALKNALKIRRINPEARVFILYRDMMTYGFLEQYYTQARGEGIVFINYHLDNKPQVEIAEGKPVVRFTDEVLKLDFEIEADVLALSTGIQPDESNRDLAMTFGVDLNQDGFFQEAESKWRPVDFLRAGVFVAGVAHSPRSIGEVVVQAEAAAQRAFAYLSRRFIVAPMEISRVHDAICSRCLTCISACPYGARSYDAVKNRVVVNAAVCQGCGMCSAACPNGAAEVMNLSEKQVMAILDSTLYDVGFHAAD